MALLPCPDSLALKRLLDGSLPEAEQAGLHQHLESCARCQEKLQTLAAGNQSWVAAARYLKRPDSVQGGALQQAMSKLRAEGRPGQTQDEADARPEITLDFLDPPVKPRQLGKLDHYEVIEVVGRGGMGVVFKALDPSLHRIVAMKVMAPQLAAVAASRQRFLREAKNAAAVTHDNVVTIHAVAETKGLPYLVMQYVAGVSLQERLERKGPLTVKEILRIGMQTAAGLEAAHKQGLIHRDIKPANILLENGIERVKITDFGLARAVNDASLTQTGVIVGTPQYMAPEQASGGAVDPRADLFSLGSVLYFMCTGQPPFDGDSSLAVLRKVCEDTPRPITDIRPEIPEWLVEIIEKLQAKDPAQRYQSAGEVAKLLEQHYARLQQSGQSAALPRPKTAPARPKIKEPAAPPPRPRIKEPPAAPRQPSRSRLPLILGLMAAGLLLVVCLGVVGIVVGLVVPAWQKAAERARVEVEPPLPPVPGPEKVGEKEPPVAREAEKEKGGPGLFVPERRPPDNPPPVVAKALPPLFERLSEDPVVLKGHTDAVWSVAFSPDSKQLASGGKDRSLRLWDLASGKETDHTGIFVAHLESMFYSKDGTTLFIGDGPAVRMWDIKNRKMKVLDQGANARNHNLIWIHGIALSPDGGTLALGYTDHYYDDTGRPVVLWDLGKAAIRTRLPVEGMLGGGVYSLAYSPDGTRLAIAKGDKAHLWKTTPGAEKEIAVCKGHNGRIRSLAFSPDGKLLATASFDKTVRLWDGATGEEVLVLEGHTNRVHALAFAPGGKALASGSVDGTIRFWDVPSGKRQGSLAATPTEGGTLAFSPDGKYFAAGCLDHTVKVWTISAKARDKTAIAKALPADLDLVPGDGAAFISLQVADTWKNPALAALRKQAEEDPMIAGALMAMKQAFVLDPGDLQRVVAVFWGKRKTPYSIALITTVVPYDRKRALALLEGEPREIKVGDKSVLLSPKTPMALHLVNDRTVVYGRAADMRAFLGRPAAPTRKASWNEVLASVPQHTAVIAVQRDLFPDDPKKDVPPELKGLLPLLDARTAVATVDAGNKLRLGVRLNFAREEEAKKAERAAGETLTLARTFLGQFVAALKKEPPPPLQPHLPKVLQVLQDAESAVQKATIQTNGPVLECKIVLQSPDWAQVLTLVATSLGRAAPPGSEKPAAGKVEAPKTPAEAEAALKKLGGDVIRDNFADGKPIVAVKFLNKKVTDADLVLLRPLTTLKELHLVGAQAITDAGLAELKPLTKLTNLSLIRLQITDKGLVQLKDLKELERLDLGGNDGITDKGLEHLKGLPKLKNLRLLGTGVSERGAEAFKKARPDVKVIN